MLLVFMGIFFVRNLMLPMASDDIPYAFVWDGEDRGNLLDSVGLRERITSFGDIVRSQYSHYMTWGGRIIGIGLTQLAQHAGIHDAGSAPVPYWYRQETQRDKWRLSVWDPFRTMVSDTRPLPHGALDVRQLCVPMDCCYRPALPTAIRQGLLD